MVEIQVKHGLHLLYSKAWRAKDHVEASVFGPLEESFKLLPAYCHRLEEVNPGTIKEAVLEMMKVNRVAFKELMNVGPERYAKKPLPDYCGDCYKTTSWVEAYAETIFSVGHPNDWNIPEDVRSKVVLPPHFRSQAGRPRKKKFKSAGEHGNGKTRNCTICKKSDHSRNAQPCQAPPPCPSVSSVTSATSKQPRRPYRCRKCGDEGHNSQKCPLVPKEASTS
ncbi:hypothetical protein Ddye_001066 [Dipteronia dyeriana]|uniref:CCHC-type domain-containing protein n=1 Tax=Dipteronia dyeriana TaxID=168575 RepID=A0AAD9XNL5_9ROSI|nr:hypothetical protein Ddye_001066 [Dipteronia dyeriana]